MASTSAQHRSAAEQPRADRPRIVANLTFAEIIIVWALRHSLTDAGAQRTRDARIAPEFSRALGLARLEESLTSLAVLAQGLARAGRLPQSEAAVNDDRVTAREEAVLATLSAHQHGASALATWLSEWLVVQTEQQRFATAARVLAEIMAEAGQFLPHPPAGKRPPTTPSAAPIQNNLIAPADDRRRPVTGRQGLTAAEQHLLTGLRLWVQAFKEDDEPLEAVRRHFGQQADVDPGLSLHAILRNTTLTALRPIDVRCRNCPGLSPDEARLLDCIAWLQRGAAEPATAALAAWLPPSALRLSLGAARSLATGLMLDNRVLPLRDWDYPALEAAAHPPASQSDGTRHALAASPTLH
ncbi:hypothetical protein HBA54_19795 [Pelagibius litoralis]|uniref:Uncharacterized protein n=1 Tax=Pelagibius litoralis TaxID=374515 RepID=A0A967KH27_9PROT|nr:hypothetical protein [Pelagibius litoralis]NIA70846.1 hypothetical protein [Pelagibius litoralis]